MARYLAFLVALLVSSYATALQDPTRPGGQSTPAPTAVVGQVPAVELSSIVYSAERRVAIINDVPRREGETFDGMRLKRIHPGRIELVVNGQVLPVHLAHPPRIRASQ